MSVVVTLRDYLKQLEGQEAAKSPAQRRQVPTVAELAEATGVSRQTMYNMVNGQVKMVNLETLAAIINTLRDQGFKVNVSDLLVAYPTRELQPSQ